MTSEVCVMNRLAAVLAADSATTVTYWNNNEKEERYFKGANKVFQVSDHHPIGMMIYDSVNILGIPWELCIKEFRRSLGEKSFNEVRGYADEFFKFISENSMLFPMDERRKSFHQSVLMQCFAYLLHKNEDEPDSDKDEHFAARRAQLDARSRPSCITEGDELEIVESFLDDTKKTVSGFENDYGEAIPSDHDAFSQYLIKSAIYIAEKSANSTGIIFAGFGDRNPFPSMNHFERCFFMGEKFVFSSEEEGSVDRENPAYISAFAQTSMTDTFQYGVSFDVFRLLSSTTKDVLDDLIKSLGVDPNDRQTSSAIAHAKDELVKKVLAEARTTHAYPLRRVLGTLPVDEMAGLAETLIDLQSLKEKVTKPSESVGGPIDVAVITRSEGLVWIKRKHFFDAELNSRYLQRQAARSSR